MDATEVRSLVEAGEHCAGTLHRPENPPTGSPCVVLANGVSMTRRDGVERFATHFAGAGLFTLTLDFRHLGDSDGELRQLIDVTGQIEDLQAAVAFARNVEGVDPDRVGLWGFSLGGGVALAAAAADDRIAATVLLCPMVDGASCTFAGDIRNNLRIIRATARALIRRPPARLPLTASPGQAAIFTQEEAAEGFEAVRAPDSLWRNAILFPPMRPAPTFRPVRHASGVRGPLLACFGAPCLPVSGSRTPWCRRPPSRRPRHVLLRASCARIRWATSVASWSTSTAWPTTTSTSSPAT